MKKIKHSKFKNTGFIFELLVRQITSEIMSANKSVAERILKEHFNSKKELSKELKLYQYLINEKYNSESKAEKFIDTILEARKRLDETKLTREKYNLIKEIKDTYNFTKFVAVFLWRKTKLKSKIFGLVKTVGCRVVQTNASIEIAESAGIEQAGNCAHESKKNHQNGGV